MSFISVLFALLLEQVRPLSKGNTIHSAMRAWVRWSARNFDAGKFWHGWLAWGFSVGLPSLIALAVYWSLNLFLGWPFGVLWSALVLYTSLGFRQFSSHFTQIRDALSDGDEALARVLLNEWQNIDAKEMAHNEIIVNVIEHSVLAAHRHVFGVLAWFSVLAAFGLGPTGAVMYRLSEFVMRYWHHKSVAHHQPVSQALQDNANNAWLWMDWVPARLTAIGFAVVGNFEEAIDGWRRYAQESTRTNDGLVLAATAGAVNICLSSVGSHVTGRPSGQTEQDGGERFNRRQMPELAHLAVVVGLVWRTVVMWLVLLALLTLARLLG
jgi:adenosylcobinamide-phosphate synthase